jgi:hypothetical protein
LIARGSPEKRVKTLERMTAFFLDGASRFNDDHVRLFDLEHVPPQLNQGGFSWGQG